MSITDDLEAKIAQAKKELESGIDFDYSSCEEEEAEQQQEKTQHLIDYLRELEEELEQHRIWED